MSSVSVLLQLEINISDAILQLRTLDSRPEARFDLGSIAGDAPRCKTFLGRDLDGKEFAAWVRENNGAQERNCYVTANEARADAPRDKKLSDKDIGLVRAAFVDIDPDKVPQSQALESLANSPLTPTMIVNSGHGAWGFFVYPEPVTVESVDARGQQAALIEAFRGDEKCKDLSRFVRLAGTINRKKGRQPIRASVEVNDFWSTPADVAAAWPPIPQADRNKPTAVGAEIDSPAAVARAKHYLEHDAPECVQGEHGDSTLIVVINHVGDIGISEQRGFALMADFNDAKCSPPWPLTGPDSLKTKVRSAYNSRQNAVGCDWRAPVETEFPSIETEKTDTPSQRFVPTNILRMSFVEKQDYVVKGLLLRGQGGFLTAPPNAGKSPLALDLGAHIAAGRPWQGRRVKQGYVYYFATEGGAGIKNRMEAVRREHFAEYGDKLPLEFFVGSLNLQKENSRDIDDLARVINARAAEFGLPPALVEIDTYSHTITGSDSADEVARPAIRNLRRLSTLTGAAVLALAHPPKDRNVMLRGSDILKNDLDFVWRVDQEPKSAVRTFSTPRMKDFQEIKPLQFRIKSVELWKDEEGDPVTAPVIDWPADFDILDPLEQRILDLVAEMQKEPKTSKTSRQKSVRTLLLEKLGSDVSESTLDRRLSALVNASRLANPKPGLFIPA